MTRTRLVVATVTTVALCSIVTASLNAQKGNGPASQLTIVATGYDPVNQLLSITGANFGTQPAVAFELQPLTVVTATPQLIVAVLPPSYPPGTYLVTVSRGPSTWDNSSFVVTIGSPGATGPSGAAGSAGPAGPAGVNGATGATGPAGPAGPAGANGALGATGAQGSIGSMGPQGPAGTTGPAGATGATGLTGLTWRGDWDGAQTYAEKDTVAFNGASYLAINANAGSQPPSADWNVLAQNGAAGAAGATGAQGATGTQGATGAQGTTGAQGATGPQGPQGAIGPAGATGQTGSTGPGNTIATGISGSTTTIALTCTNYDGGTVTISAIAGHVVEVTGAAWLRLNHTAGTKDAGFVVIGTTPTDCAGADVFYWSPFSVSASATADLNLDTLVPVRAVFTATITGPVTYYLNAIMSSGQDARDRFWFANLAAHAY